jgi:hypothetical protein
MVQHVSWEWLLEGFKIDLETQLKPRTLKDYCDHVSYFAQWAQDNSKSDPHSITKRNMQGKPITREEARKLILLNFQVPEEIKRERRRRKATSSSTKPRRKKQEMAAHRTNEAAVTPQPVVTVAISRI